MYDKNLIERNIKLLERANNTNENVYGVIGYSNKTNNYLWCVMWNPSPERGCARCDFHVDRDRGPECIFGEINYYPADKEMREEALRLLRFVRYL